MIEPLPLAQNKREWFIIIFILFFIFVINLLIQYNKYLSFKTNEIYTTSAKIINIYDKLNYKVLKLDSKNITFFTSYNQNIPLNKNDKIKLTIVTNNINFFDYIKGFYALSFNIFKITQHDSSLLYLNNLISLQHKNNNISELFNALFFATPTSSYLKNVSANYGISHLLAISGFHLGVLSFVLYFLINILYKPLKQKYFPFRNTKFDILILVSIMLFSYVLLLGLIPSLLRAFIMFILGIIFLRSNIKLFSFSTLLLVVLIIIALFPKLIFSLSLWFSTIGVFYIFLFLQYYKNLNKIILFFLFNIWIYLAMNPIVHFFFPIISLEQLYSPIFTIVFSLFYPVELFLHIINCGDLFDKYIEILLTYEVITKEIFTPNIFLIYYIFISFLSIQYKNIFILLNISFIFFNLWLFI